MSKRYDVLDQNGDVLDSFDSWGLAVTRLADWERGADVFGDIRDNETGEFVY